jgi:soluble lytic murein transglycosylase-like protein
MDASRAAAETFFFRDRAGVTHFTNVPTDRRYKVLKTAKSSFSQIVYKKGGGSKALARLGYGTVSFSTRKSRFIEPPAELSTMITEAANRYGVDPALVHAVVRAESAFDHLAVSRAGAMGLMQLMPGTADLVGVRDAFHPQENVEGGVYYLRMMLDRFGHNVALALAAYNAGPGAVESYGGIPPYSETQEYLERVFRFRQEYLHKSIERAGAARGRVTLASQSVRR